MPPAPLPHLLFWVATAVCIVAQVAILRAALAGRTPGASPSALARAREVLWTVLPAVALALLLAGTWRALPRAATRPVPVASAQADA